MNLLSKSIFAIKSIISSISLDEEIHKAVFSAQEELINEAEKILSSLKSDNELGDVEYSEKVKYLKIMKEIGFVNSKEVVELTKKLDAYQENKRKQKINQSVAEKQIKLIHYYGEKYPNNKFIDKESIKSICNRFGLLFAPVGLYSDEIPVKNMAEISVFKCDIEDKMLKSTITIDSDELASKISGEKIQRFNRGIVTIELSLPFFGKDILFYNDIQPIILSEIKSRYNISLLSYKVRSDNFSQVKSESDELENAMIIAPKNKFSIPKDYVVENGFEVGYRKIVVIKDPVVLQPVIGGYLIVSAWGFEETLPEINSANNVDISRGLN